MIESFDRAVPDVPLARALRFRVLRPLAKGGLGEVFVARDEELRREVALKLIQEQFAGDTDSRDRFLFEAEITGRLEHPGVVPVYGLGVDEKGRPYYAMRFIRGESLKESIARFHRADGPTREPGERSLALRELLGRFHQCLQHNRLRTRTRGPPPRLEAGQCHARQLRRDTGRGLGIGQDRRTP